MKIFERLAWAALGALLCWLVLDSPLFAVRSSVDERAKKMRDPHVIFVGHDPAETSKFHMVSDESSGRTAVTYRTRDEARAAVRAWKEWQGAAKTPR